MGPQEESVGAGRTQGSLRVVHGSEESQWAHNMGHPAGLTALPRKELAAVVKGVQKQKETQYFSLVSLGPGQQDLVLWPLGSRFQSALPPGQALGRWPWN